MYLDDCVCVLPDLAWLPLLGVGRKSWYIIIIIFKYSDIGFLWSQITIFIIEITLKLLLHKKYRWNNPNWSRLGLKNPKLHFFDISGSSKLIVNINVQINVTRSIFSVNCFFFFEMPLIMSSIRINNNWYYKKSLIILRRSP